MFHCLLLITCDSLVLEVGTACDLLMWNCLSSLLLGMATYSEPFPSASATLRHKTPSPARSSPSEKPRVMFTGVIDKEGERTVRELGGELVDSVYNCTHLVTDKVSPRS